MVIKTYVDSSFADIRFILCYNWISKFVAVINYL